uniref:BTB domain-containing protein n=1 Tax=Globodera rostochiensis TaxID=31243 RepID=A0A914GPC1_GLORO
MKRSRTQSSSNTGGDQIKDNKYKRGQIVFRMPNFKAFSERGEPKEVLSDPAVYINGLPWRIQINHLDAFVSIYLHCDGDETDAAWNCRAAFQFCVVSCNKSAECLMKEGDLDTFHIYTVNCPSWGYGKFVKIEELMDPKNGFYVEEEDAVTFKAQVITEEGVPEVRLEDALLVNGIVVYVNKHLLAAHSKFFQILFFGENAEKSPNIQIEELSDAVDYFERLIFTMYPHNMELNDECIENVLMLANRFLLGVVEKRCVEFLLTKSKKSAICKFRLAHQCGIGDMKKKILAEMTKHDFLIAGENYMDNYSENTKLGAEAMRELSERHKELFGTK